MTQKAFFEKLAALREAAEEAEKEVENVSAHSND